MAAAFIQTRNGTVSIIKDLTIEEAEKVVDVAFGGPAMRAEQAWRAAKTAEQKRIADVYFSGNPGAKEITLRDHDGQPVIWTREGLKYRAFAVCIPRPCADHDVVRAEVIA